MVKRGGWQLMPANSVNLELPSEGYQAAFRKAQFKPDAATVGRDWAPHPALASRKERESMTEWSKEGEQPWTNMDPWGSECISQAVHVIGFCVGYQGLVSFNKSVTDARKDRGFLSFDPQLEPPVGRPPPDGTWDGTARRERQSVPSAGLPSSSTGL